MSMQLLVRLLLLRLVGGMLPLDAVLKGKQQSAGTGPDHGGHGHGRGGAQQQQHAGHGGPLDDIIARYSLPNGTSRFTHLTYDPTRRLFYAGATNRVLQLNENLTLLREAITGPKLDSAQCHAAGCPPDVLDSVETDNVNKVLLYNRDGDTLIACGSVHQGACDIYYLSGRFPESSKPIEVALAANDERSSTYAFIGPSRYQSWKREDIMYVGTTFTNVGDYRHDVPAISSRRLDDLTYAEFSIQQSNINIDVKYRDHFLVNYVYGFNSTEYAYFVLVQKKSHLADEAGYVTRLARICVNDPNYDSYTEVTITCMVNGTDYNILRDAKLAQAGQKLSNDMGIKREDYLLVAVFSPSKEITDEPQNRSAICMYSLKDIEEVFNENIHSCFNGTIKDRNLGYISGTINDGKCPVAGSLGNIFSFCHVGLKISGVTPVIASARFAFGEGVSLTSIAVTSIGPHTLAFVGSNDGWIRKVLLSGREAGEYERMLVDEDGSAILPDSMFAPTNDHLYVLTERKIIKMKVEHCGTFGNCSACLESRDPYCGWCSLEKRCTVRTACQKDTSAARWLSIGTGQQCIDFEMVAPDRVPVGQMSVVRLVIKTLPELPHNAQYRCVFGNATPIDANVTKEGLICSTPPVNERPALPDGQDHVLVPLSVRSSETNKDFVSRSFAFYDCTRHDTCRKCLVSNWGCHWCIYDNRCAFNTTACRNSANIVQNEASCPRLKHRAGPILLPNKVPKEIRLEIENLPRPQSAHTGFLCTINIEGAHMVLPARVEANKYIVCEKTLYSYEAATNEYEATVDVNWNRNHYIDTVTVILYKCEILGSHRDHADCSLCVTRDPKYQCTWCGQQCSYNESCIDGGAGSMMLRGRGEEGGCPRPRIDLIKPLSGPIEGGTLVTIEGSNLGIREEDVRGRIHIGEVPCELERYEISVRIECRTGPVRSEMSAPVKVGNEAGYTMSSVEFRYRDVRLEGLSPTMGPQSGGTKLSIIGKHLNVGTAAIAYLDDYECRINRTQASSSRLTCVTSAARSPEHIRVLTLRIDGANRTLACSTSAGTSGERVRGSSAYGSAGTYHSRYETCSVYNYTVDPKIMQIKPLKSFLSGGRMMTVHGTNLDAIQLPEIEVYLNDERLNRSICAVLNSNQMECPSPSVREAWTLLQQQQTQLRNLSVAGVGAGDYSPPRMLSGFVSADGRTVPIQQQQPPTAAVPMLLPSQYSLSPTSGPLVTAASAPLSPFHPSEQQLQLLLQINFLMDSVLSVRNLPKHFQNLRSAIVYVEDPVYQPFPNAVKLYKGDTLVIEGEHLNAASDETDVNVTIGTAQCNVTSLAPTQLVCTPPLEQPEATDENGVPTANDLPLVVVRVGRNLRFPIGFIKYDLIKPYAFSHVLFGVIVSGIFFVLSLLAILFIYRRKSTLAEREYKRIQIQMDTLESNVRMECKQAFAELQTDMTDLTADLESSGTPTLDLVNYVMKVFFPGVADHPVLLANGAKLHGGGGGGGHHHHGHGTHHGHPHQRNNYDQAMVMFEQLINNRVFLLLFIDTLEAQKTFTIRDKVNVASLLMIVLMNQMDYVTDILKSLLLRLIDKSVMTKHPQLMLRRTESVVEKMLTNYMALCMYDYLRNYAGNSLFLLYKAIKHQIEKGLVDAVTHDARYSLSEDRLLREQIVHSVVTLHIIQDDLDEKVQCKVLDCDTISQVKSKVLDALFKNTPFSLRPSVHDLDLEWRHGRGGHLVLRDEDVTTKSVHGWKRLNTLAHYGVKESAVMSLVARPHDGYNTPGRHIFPYCYYINNPPSSNHHLSSSATLPHGGSGSAASGPGSCGSSGTMGPAHTTDTLLAGSASHHHHHHPHLHPHHVHQQHAAQAAQAAAAAAAQQQQQSQVGVFHLVKPQDDRFSTLSSYDQHGSSSSSAHGALYGGGPGSGSHHKAIPEIFLTRLLATKGTIQKFVDDLFATILTVNEALPPAVKWLYDLLDAAARHHGIHDPEVIHAWKSNGLPLRFWVNFIKNPDFIFDIYKTPSVDVCLSVIAQTFMDACSTTEYRLGKDSPSNKLLFAKDLPQYREMVSNFYADIAMMPQISDQEMRSAMQRLSIHQQQFDTLAALKELYVYVSKYRLQIKEVLEMDLTASKLHLAHKLDLVAATLEDDECKTIDYYE